MIRSSVDLPAPFGPSTPIFAPGQERERDVREHLPVRAVELVGPVHRVDVVAHRPARVPLRRERLLRQARTGDALRRALRAAGRAALPAQGARRDGPGARPAGLRSAASRAASVLEIGGGVGQVLLELPQAGARRARSSSSSRATSSTPRARGRGGPGRAGLLPDRRPRRRPARPPAADVVVLNKVVCCTPDGVELAGARGLARAAHARAQLPARRLVGAALLRRGQLFFRLRGGAPSAPSSTRRRRSGGAAEAHGLALASERDGPLFRIAAFERA